MARNSSDPAMKREKVNARLPNYMLSWLSQQDESSGVLIERALMGYYGLNQPGKPGRLSTPEMFNRGMLTMIVLLTVCLV